MRYEPRDFIVSTPPLLSFSIYYSVFSSARVLSPCNVYEENCSQFGPAIGDVRWAIAVELKRGKTQIARIKSDSAANETEWEAALVARAQGEKVYVDETEDDADEPGMADDESLGVERGSSVVE